MANPFSDSNPFLRKRRKLPAQEEYSQEEKDNLLDSLGSSAMSGMNYVGGMLDKFTGSRALRGVLGGKPRELLSIIPGSDTFGITDQKDTVYGKDLLNWDDPNSIADDVAGFALDAALDPTWLVGGGAVSAGGKALKAAGLGAKATKLGKLAGKGSRVSRMTTTARQALEHGTKLPVGGLAHGVQNIAPGLDLFPKEWENFSRAATKMGKDPLKILDDPIQESLATIRLPFMDEPLLKIGTGAKSLAAAGAMDATGKAITAPLRGYKNKLADDAEKAFRTEMRSAAPASVTDDMLDRQLDVYRSYAEGYHGETLGEFIRSKKLKASDVLPTGGETLFQGDRLWESKFINTVEKNTNKRFGLQELKSMAKKAGVKDEEIEWAELDGLFAGKGDAHKASKAEVSQWLKERIDPDALIEEVDDATMRGDAQGGLVTPGGVPGTTRTWALRAPKVGAGATTAHLGDITDPIGYVRVQDWELPGGKKALLVENIQSDLHQLGAKQGYGNKGVPPATLQKMQVDAWEDFAKLMQEKGVNPEHYLAAEKRYQEMVQEGHEPDFSRDFSQEHAIALEKGGEAFQLDDNLADAYETYNQLMNNAAQLERNGPPNLPFKGNRWVEKLLQKVAKEAVKGGYDEILITSGAVQESRWRHSSSNSEGLRKFYDETVQDAAKRAIGARGKPVQRNKPAGDLKWKWNNEVVGETGQPQRYLFADDEAGIPWTISKDGRDEVNWVLYRGNDDIARAADVESLKKMTQDPAISQPGFYSIPVKDIKKGPYSLFQGGQANAKAATSFMPSGEIILSTFKKADFSSHVHEFGHVASKFLTDSDRAIVNKFLGKADNAAWDTWTKADHEKFAEGLEKFFTTGAAPKGALEQVWAKIQAWMLNIYNSVAKRGQLADVSPAVNEVYQRMLQGRPANLRGYTQAGSASPGVMKLAGLMDKSTDWLKYNKGTRYLAELFDASAMGTRSEAGQDFARDVYRAMPEARQEAMYQSGKAIAEMGEKNLLDPTSGRALRRQAEGFEPVTQDTANIIQTLGTGVEDAYQRAKRVGAAGERIQDIEMPKYAPRSAFFNKHKQAIRKALNSVFDKDVPTNYERYGFLKKVVGGSDALENRILTNPSLVGDAKAPTKRLHLLELESLRQTLLPHHTDKEIEQLSKFLRKLPQNVIDEKFYKNVAESSQDYMVGLAEKTAIGEKAIEHMVPQMSKRADGMEPWKVLKALRLRRGGPSNSQLKKLGEMVTAGTKTADDVAAAMDRMSTGAYSRLSEQLGITNPTATLATQLRAGATTPDAAIKAAMRWQTKINRLKVAPELADDMVRAKEFFKGPKAVNAIVSALDQYTNLFKAGVLTWPARFVRDFISGQAQNWMLGVFNPRTVELSRRIIAGEKLSMDELKQIPIVTELLAKEGLPATPENANRLLRAHLYSMEIIGERVSDMSQIGGPKAVQGIQQLHAMMPGVSPLTLKEAGKQAIKLEDWKNYGKQFRPHKPSTWGVRGVAGAEDMTNPLLKGANVTGVTIDSLNRLPAYIEFLKKGLSPAEAKRRVLEAHVDYSNKALTKPEQAIATRAIPFYRFLKGSTKKTVTELLKNPHGRMAQVVRGGARTQQQSEDGRIVPEHLQRTLAIPMPNNAVTELLGLSAPEGNTRYLTGLGLMHEDPLSLFQPGSSAFHSAQATGQGLIGRLNPVVKAPLEIAFGKQAFSGRELEDLDPNLGRIAANVTGSDTPVRTPILLEHAIANSPLSRGVSSLRALTDTRENALGKAALNLGTGVRLSDMENEKARNLAIRKLLEESLRGSPGVHRFEHLFAPDDTKLTEEEKAIMELYRQFGRESAKKARERKKAG